MVAAKTKRNRQTGKKWLRGLAAAAIIVLLFSGFYFFYARYEPHSGYGDTAWSSASAFNPNSIKSVNLGENQTQFKIAQLTDLHLIFGNIFGDHKAFKYIDAMLKIENPDICIVTGDATMSPLNESSLKYLCEFMEKRQQYWAFTFGNHDSEFGISKYRVCQLLSGYKYSLFSVGPRNIGGAGNYFVNIKNSNGDIVYTLCMMDSGMYGDGINITEKYGSFSGKQVEWYEWTLRNIVDTVQEGKQGANSLQSMAFFHIPIKQYQNLYDSGSYDGKLREPVSPQGKETGFFDAVKRVGSTKAMFVGHDHVNDMRGYYEGVYLCYGRTGGFGSYPWFESDNWFVKMIGGSDDATVNGSLLDGGKGFTIIEISDLNPFSNQYGAFAVRDLLHKDIDTSK